MHKVITNIFVVLVLVIFSIPVMANDTTVGTLVGNIDGQGQGQGQGQSIDDHSTNISEASERGYPIPGSASFGPVISYYGKPLPTAQFRPVESLLLYGHIFSEGALEQIVLRGNKIIHELEVVQSPDFQTRANYEEGETRWIKIIATSNMMEDHGLIGYATSEANDRKTSMLEVVAQAALDALQQGADVLQIIAQGASRDTVTSGWGIGFNTTQATMGSGPTGSGSANISSGGTGYSQAWAGMRDKPWIQANALKAPEKVTGRQLVEEEVTEEVAE